MYLCHTPDFGLWYSASSSLALHGFSDADFAGCQLDRTSTSRRCQFLGSSLVSWSSRKQSTVAQSSTEAEYISAPSCCSQLLWITYTISGFGEEYTHIPLQCDSTSAISVAKNRHRGPTRPVGPGRPAHPVPGAGLVRFSVYRPFLNS
jgi:hypothetical protein